MLTNKEIQTLRRLETKAIAELRQLRAEREASFILTDDMLRYAMSAMGTGSPAEADRFKAFWSHAMHARRNPT